MACRDFYTLCKVWKHARLPLRKKVAIFEACVVAKLMYCVHTLWLNVPDSSKLDAFQARCLRKMAGIGHSYYSRVCNATVLQTCACRKLSATLAYRQVCLLGRIAVLPNDSPVRLCVFKPHSFALSGGDGPRKRGRPRNTWKRKVHELAVRVAGNTDALHGMLQGPPGTWQIAARRFFFT